MSHEWDRGVLNTSSWHGLEDIAVMLTALDMIKAAETSGSWPVKLDFEDLFTSGGLKASARALVGTYANHSPRVLGCVGDRYRATTPEEWRSLCEAAVAAGAKPTGAFSLRGGSRVVATFDLGGNGIRTQLVLVDSFDGSMKLTAMVTSVRVVCANTLSLAIASDGEGMEQLRHTASLETKINVLKEAIQNAIKTGGTVKAAFEAAENMYLNDRAFRPEAPADAAPAAKTKAANMRRAAVRAGRMSINRVGNGTRGNLGTLWNAATYLVDRREDGTFRETRGGDALDSLLFGSRSERIIEIQETIEIVMADNSLERMTVTNALEAGVSAKQIASMLVREAMGDA